MFGGVGEEDSQDLLFHGNGYNLSVSVLTGAGGSDEPVLAIDLEHLETGAPRDLAGGAPVGTTITPYLADVVRPPREPARSTPSSVRVLPCATGCNAKTAGTAWTAEFGASYLESVTQKTGAYGTNG